MPQFCVCVCVCVSEREILILMRGRVVSVFDVWVDLVCVGVL